MAAGKRQHRLVVAAKQQAAKQPVQTGSRELSLVPIAVTREAVHWASLLELDIAAMTSKYATSNSTKLAQALA